MLPLSEHELKYRANLYTLSTFQARMKSLPGLKKYAPGGGWDHYFLRSADSFWRLRVNPGFSELTKKVKIKGSNQHRKEHDIKLEPGISSSPEYIASALADDGYSLNFAIFKAYDVWVFDQVNYVYYVVLDEDWHEVGRFVEIEINKDQVANIKNPTKVLFDAADKLFKPDNIVLARETKSLLELYRR
jgi:adenylate cyclase class IV